MRLCLLLCALIFGITAATPVSPATLTHVFSADMERKIDDLGRDVVASGRAPGIAVGIVEDGRIVYAHGFGYANIARRSRMAPDTEFYAGSISKQFTAAAILLLAQDGKLNLGDKVTKYVPELTVAGNATVMQLLDQTSGLPDYTKATGISLDTTKSTKLGDIIAAVDKMQPASAPGAEFAYNNFNYMIAGLIVERVAQVPLSDYLQSHIFYPLLMNQTFYAGDTGISSTHAVGYTGSAGRFHPAAFTDPAWLYGAGGVVSDIYDLAKWDIGLPLLLRVDAERQMFTASDAPGAMHYGLGWVIDSRDGKRYIWHNGEIPGFHAMNALLPDDHVAVIVAVNTDSFSSTNVASPEALAGQILDIVLPPATTHVDNAIVAKAREWIDRLQSKRIDRTQLTPAFSAILTDELLAKADFASLGKPLAIVPISSTTQNGDTAYEFLVRFAHEQDRYTMSVTKDGKIDGLRLQP